MTDLAKMVGMYEGIVVKVILTCHNNDDFIRVLKPRKPPSNEFRQVMLLISLNSAQILQDILATQLKIHEILSRYGANFPPGS
ncbi:hypothetical protein TSAR_000128 [Trichomalopsis sarcophagae]|uniref:Uncharacterized protein n=1 Tax=Trichomalopsis sarcophagae TaxID=543379 RepID=A0A232F6Q6_9HYME|nr:hypothetical protein TSAR_000128 [Trichomalopsis sarcophagae]